MSFVKLLDNNPLNPFGPVVMPPPYHQLHHHHPRRHHLPRAELEAVISYISFSPLYSL